MRILLAEDDLSLGETTSRALRSQNWIVDWTQDGGTVPDAVKQGSYDLVILDVGLPRMNGFEILRYLRSQGNDIGILMLTARDAVEDRVHGFQLGADDYLVKPFALTELIARIQAIAKRIHTRQHNEILLGTLRLDLTAKCAFLADQPLELLPREWAVLVYLLNHAGKLVSKEQILEAISGLDDTPSSNAIEVYVSRLRSKLANSGITIRAVRGFGYRIDVTTDCL